MSEVSLKMFYFALFDDGLWNLRLSVFEFKIFKYTTIKYYFYAHCNLKQKVMMENFGNVEFI